MSARVELEKLYERDGFLNAEQVLAAASDPDSPLHGRFTWDDSEAAQKWRLHQAGLLIRSCKITVQTGGEQTSRVRAFLNLPADDGGKGSFVPTADALTDERARNVVLAQALREVAALRRKYQALIDFDHVLAEAMKDASEAAA